MTLDLEAKAVEAKVLTTLASIAGSTGGRSGGGWPERGESQEALYYSSTLCCGGTTW
jgi:hypothetical protein